VPPCRATASALIALRARTQTMKLVISACDEAMQSKRFLKILEIVLAVGNYLNGSTFRGGAWGYKIEVLTKACTRTVLLRR
jgi:hypothetical protein